MRILLRHLCAVLLTALLGGLIAATMVRLAPGFGVEEQELDSRLNGASIQALRESHASERNIFHYYVSYLSGLARGDLGVSSSLRRPVAQLFAERAGLTLQSVSLGLLGGWILGFGLALPAALRRRWAYDLASTLASGLFLCLPSAVLAFLLLSIGGPVPVAIALVVFPQVFRYSRNLLVKTCHMPHVLMAKAKGLGGLRILLWHILPPAAPPMLALVGVSVSMAFGAAIPIEAICDSPGLGQLAWQAALGRDMPLLINMTLLVTLMTLAANALADFAGTAFLRQAQ